MNASGTSPAGPKNKTEAIHKLTGDAFGLGAALVVLPCVGLYLGIDRLAANATVGLPVMAIFGIMILFGALALVATLFQRLGLTNPNQALALPEGSIRAAIALALIVLFAIISIMLYRSILEPYKITGLTLAERKALLEKSADRVMASIDEPCQAGAATAALAASAAGTAGPATGQPVCAPEDQRYTLHLRPPPAQESTDLAKQLLILVGTLMTSVTSFYFATRGAAPPTPKAETPLARLAPPPEPEPAPAPAVTPETKAPPPAASEHETHADGCNVDITDATPDEDLPPASGGVAS
jgi:hypothetical protein